MTMLVCSCQPHLALLLGRWHIGHSVEPPACLRHAPLQLFANFTAIFLPVERLQVAR